MPYTKGKMKGKLTITELRRLVNAHNYLSSIKLPRGIPYERIIAILDKEGYDVDHKGMKITPKKNKQVKRKPVITEQKAQKFGIKRSQPKDKESLKLAEERRKKKEEGKKRYAEREKVKKKERAVRREKFLASMKDK